jgi:hypothetical protein
MTNGGHAVKYTCRDCRGVGIRANDVEPLVYGAIIDRLTAPDAIDLLCAEIHDAAAAEETRRQITALKGKCEAMAVSQVTGTGEYADWTPAMVSAASTAAEAQIAELEATQQDQDRLRVLDGIPLGTPEAADAVRALTPDRFRAVVTLLCTVTIAPVGRGHKVFDPNRVVIDWKE